MRSVVLEQPQVVKVSDAREPSLGPEQALVRLRAAGICGSDLAAYRGVSPHIRYPCILGHELVVDVLDAPERPELVGRRAVVEPLVSCGACRACRLGRYNCCTDLQVMGVHVDGGFRERSVVDVRRLYAVPDEMPDDVAALAEPTSIAYRAVQRSQIAAGRVAVVLGCGTIGMLIAHILMRARGCRVVMVDIDEWRLGVARQIGAIPLKGAVEHVVSEVEAATDGDLADVVFEASGSAACTRMATELVAQAGRIVLIGWNKGPVEFDTVTLMRKEAEVLGSRNSANAFPAVLRLLADGLIDPERLVTHRVGMDDVGEALAMLDRGEERALKVLIRP